MCIRFGKRFAEKCAELVTAIAVNVSDGLIGVVIWVCTSLVDASSGVALMMPNPDSLGRLTPFSVKRAGVHPNRWFWVCFAASVCLFCCMLLERVHYWLAKSCYLSLRYLVFSWNFFGLVCQKVVNECQVSFGFRPAKSQLLIRTASFFAEVQCVWK